MKKWTSAINLEGNFGCHTLRKTFGYIQRTEFGVGFDVKQYIEPRHPLDEHGRGIYLIHTIMDEISYQPTENGHVLEMVKNL